MTYFQEKAPCLYPVREGNQDFGLHFLYKLILLFAELFIIRPIVQLCVIGPVCWALGRKYVFPKKC